eukprot:m.209977 g.209977  ORF g.209977 m.209977 type:complete len:187 (+) comp17142_c0_seq72:1440-2000(+)
MLQLVQDESVIVQDSVAWMLGAICDSFPEIVAQPSVLPAVLSALDTGLSLEPRVANNACHAITFLVEGVYELAEDHLGAKETEVTSNALSSALGTMLQRLIAVTDRDDVTESNLRSAAFEALSASVQFAPTDCYPMVLETTNVMLQRLQACGSMPVSRRKRWRLIKPGGDWCWLDLGGKRVEWRQR